MLSLPLVAGFAAAVLATSFISGIFGMAGGLILMGMLLLVLPVAPAMMLHGVTQLASNGWRAFLWRAHIRWGIVGTYTATAIATTVAFALLPFTTDKATALLVMGLTPFAALLLPASFRPNATRPAHMVVCSITCSLLQVIGGVTGPVLDMLFVHSGMDRRRQVATKGAIQVIGHGLKIAYFGGLMVAGGAEALPAWIYAVAIGFAMAGTTLSRRVLDALSDVQFKSWTQRIVLGVSSIYVVQGLLLLARAPG